jgi:replicative DNA helicase
MVQNFNRKAKNPENSVVYEYFTGRMQSYSIDFEQAFLACCIIEGGQDSIIFNLQSKISVDSFYLSAHKILWEAILSSYEEGTPVNEIFLADRLKSTRKLESIGDIYFINKICDRIDIPAHIVHYVKRGRDLKLTRCVIKASVINTERAYGETDELNDFLEKSENEISSGR